MDSIILIIVIMFGYSAFSLYKTSLASFFIALVVAILIFIYAMMTIRLRSDLYKKIRDDDRSLSKTVAELNNQNHQAYQDFMKDILENRIMLELSNHFPEAKIMKNVYLPKYDGTTTEVDVIMLSPDGIFLIEAKNLAAQLEGDWSADTINARYETGSVYTIQNPVIQNSGHYDQIRKLLSISGNHVIKNIVVLGDNTRYSNKETIPKYASICTPNTLIKAIRFRSEISRGILSTTQIQNYHEAFLKNKENSEIAAKHIQDIKMKHMDSQEKQMK